jgi:hypothetical protein
MTRVATQARALPSLLLALCGACAALSGCAADNYVSAAIKEANDMQARLAALPPQCTLGDAAGTAGTWIGAPQIVNATGFASPWLFRFNEPVRTDAFRIALDPATLQNLEKAEIRDVQGNWKVAWTAGQSVAPAGCDVVQLAQTFTSGRREITEMRLIIHPVVGKLMFSNVSVRQAG